MQSPPFRRAAAKGGKVHDPAVKKETLRIALGTLILSAVMQGVFLIIGKWDIRVLFGNILGAAAAVLNFFLMCLTVVKCVGIEKDRAAVKIRVSQSGRLLMLAAIAGVGALLPKYFNLIALILPLLFPTVIVIVYRLAHKEKDGAPSASREPQPNADLKYTNEEVSD
ncbi:MAG: ATP synthase subunit I [Clostridia bacterium]|nr:ATP synthase subunit I [Clostridia bacterium]